VLADCYFYKNSSFWISHTNTHLHAHMHSHKNTNMLIYCISSWNIRWRLESMDIPIFNWCGRKEFRVRNIINSGISNWEKVEALAFSCQRRGSGFCCYLCVATLWRFWSGGIQVSLQISNVVNLIVSKSVIRLMVLQALSCIANDTPKFSVLLLFFFFFFFFFSPPWFSLSLFNFSTVRSMVWYGPSFIYTLFIFLFILVFFSTILYSLISLFFFLFIYYPYPFSLKCLERDERLYIYFGPFSLTIMPANLFILLLFFLWFFFK